MQSGAGQIETRSLCTGRQRETDLNFRDVHHVDARIAIHVEHEERHTLNRVCEGWRERRCGRQR